MEGDMDQVAHWLKQDPTAAMVDESSVLREAVEAGHYKLALWLLPHGDVTQSGILGEAANHGQASLVEAIQAYMSDEDLADQLPLAIELALTNDHANLIASSLPLPDRVQAVAHWLSKGERWPELDNWLVHATPDVRDQQVERWGGTQLPQCLALQRANQLSIQASTTNPPRRYRS